MSSRTATSSTSGAPCSRRMWGDCRHRLPLRSARTAVRRTSAIRDGADRRRSGRRDRSTRGRRSERGYMRRRDLAIRWPGRPRRFSVFPVRFGRHDLRRNGTRAGVRLGRTLRLLVTLIEGDREKADDRDAQEDARHRLTAHGGGPGWCNYGVQSRTASLSLSERGPLDLSRLYFTPRNESTSSPRRLTLAGPAARNRQKL
jgi:hypothetical protein